MHTQLLNTPKLEKIRFKAFLKTGEILFGPDSTIKGRIVWDPPAFIKVFLGVLNYNLIQQLKKPTYKIPFKT